MVLPKSSKCSSLLTSLQLLLYTFFTKVVVDIGCYSISLCFQANIKNCLGLWYPGFLLWWICLYQPYLVPDRFHQIIQVLSTLENSHYLPLQCCFLLFSVLKIILEPISSSVSLSLFDLYFIFSTFIYYACVYLAQHMCGGQRTTWSQFSPGIKLRSSVLAAIVFTHWTILPAPVLSILF